MKLLILILLINLAYTKNLPNEPSVISVLLRSRRSTSGESLPSLVRYDSSDSKINHQSNQRQEKEEEQLLNLLEHQEKAAPKEEKALRRLKEKQVKQEQKDEKKHEKEEQKRLERIEKEKRKEEDRKKKILKKREKEEQKKQTERKHTEKLQNETLKEESTHSDDLVNIEEEKSIDLDDIWRNLIYANYFMTLLSTRPEKQAAINKYMQEELGLISKSTSTDRRQAIVKFLEMELENNTVLLDAFKNQFISHINQVRLQKLRASLDTNIDIINKKSEIINYVKLPWATLMQENLKEQRSIYQILSRIMSNIIPNGDTGGHNKSRNSSDDSNIDLTNGNEIEGSKIMYSNVSSPNLLSLDNNTAIGNNSGSSSTYGPGINSSSDVSSGNNASLSLNDKDGDTEDVISNKDNVLPTTPFLSIVSTGFTESIIAVSVASANNDTNTEMIIKENDDTASNALVPSANAPNSESTNAVENSSSAYTVSTIANEISGLVTASDATDARSMSEKALTTTAMTIDATQKGEVDNVSVTMESNTEVSESYVTVVTVNAEDYNVTLSIDTNKTIESTLGIFTTVSPVLETVSNYTLSMKENVTLSTEATDVDTTSAQNIIEQVTVTGFNITNQLISVTAANNSVVTTTATDDLINVNTDSNDNDNDNDNDTTEPSFNGRIKQPGQDQQLINSDYPDDQTVHVQNTNGLTIPIQRYKPNLQTRYTTPPSYFRFPNFYLLPTSRPILPVLG